MYSQNRLITTITTITGTEVFYMEEGQVYSQFKRLQNARHSREYMQQLINAVDKNEVSIKKARCLGYLIKIFLDTYEIENIEERVEELEKIAKNQGRLSA